MNGWRFWLVLALALVAACGAVSSCRSTDRNESNMNAIAHEVRDAIAGDVGLRTSITSTFVDTAGNPHVVVTPRGEFDPRETPTGLARRHRLDIEATKSEFK